MQEQQHFDQFEWHATNRNMEQHNLFSDKLGPEIVLYSRLRPLSYFITMSLDNPL